MKIFEQAEIGLVIGLTLFAKWLMTEELPAEDEDLKTKKLRVRRAYGGIIAGGLVAYYGHTPLISHVEVFTEDTIIPLIIVLTISGEHLFRALITKVPEWIQTYVEKRIK